MEIGATAKILTVFVAILVVSRFRVSLGVALIAGAVALDAWAGRGAHLAGDLWFALADPSLWLFVLNISLIIEFGVFMTEGDNSRALSSAIHQWAGRHGRILSIILLPASLGLVPMPGGAMFSAPLVGEAVDGKDLSHEWKSAANYWFRHIFEFWWPLYPVVIVTLSILPIPAWKFILLQLPFTLVSILAGLSVLIAPKRRILSTEPHEREGDLQGIFLLLPLLVVLIAVMIMPQVLKLLIPSVSDGIAKLLGMTIGLGIGLMMIARHRSKSATPNSGHLLERFFTKKNVNILTTLVGVMVFKTLLDRSGMIESASRELADNQMPIAFVVGALPFLAGLVTGIAIGFAGTTFPLIVGLLASGESGMTITAALPLAFGMGYIGMMLSPLHLCLLLTKDFFEASLLKTYLYLIPCLGFIAAASIALHLIFTYAGW